MKISVWFTGIGQLWSDLFGRGAQIQEYLGLKRELEAQRQIDRNRVSSHDCERAVAGPSRESYAQRRLHELQSALGPLSPEEETRYA